MSIVCVDERSIPIALDWLFRGLTDETKAERISNTQLMLRRGEIDPRGLLVVEVGQRIRGAILYHVTAGNVGIIWPPQAARPEWSASLIAHAMQAIQSRGVALSILFLALEDRDRAIPFEAIGFRYITRIDYMGCEWTHAPSSIDGSIELIQDAGTELFTTALQASYRESLDCPELNNIRSMDEIMAGYRAEGRQPPDWYRIEQNGTCVGVLILRPDEPSMSCELVYLGVVPEARRNGIGRSVLATSIRLAQSFGQQRMWLSVDRRNTPARALYTSQGFITFDSREVWFRIGRPTQPTNTPPVTPGNESKLNNSAGEPPNNAAPE